MTASKFGNSATLILMSRSILLVLIVLITLTMITPHLVLADPLPCDIQGWPSCYNVGYQAGLANPGTNCPSSHSDNFCAGWEFGASSGGHIQNSNITAYILGSNAVKQQSTNAHTQAWLFGYYHGRDEGRDGFFDTNAACEDDQGEVSYHGVTTNLTADHNEDRCTDGYIKGWDSTCQQALRDPDAEHDIYGCPGVSDKTINHILDVDAARYKASLTPGDKAQIKADCASDWTAKNQTIVVGGKIVGKIIVPNGGVPCL